MPFPAHRLRAQPNDSAAAAAFPDSDFVLRFIDPLTYLALHRSITRSIVLLPAFFFMLIARRRYSLQPFAGVCALGIAVHITGDVITSFGTMLFAPFSIRRAQVSTTFIHRSVFHSILAGGLIASVRWKTPAPRSSMFATNGPGI